MIGNLKLTRTIRTDKSTTGSLTLNDAFLCYVLEDKDRGLRSDMDLTTLKTLKKFGETAIPAGTYKVVISMSNRFKKLLPEIKEVPGFEGVRIHSGNKPEDTEGCLIVGDILNRDAVGNSRVAFARLMTELNKYTELTLTIV